MSDKLDKLKSLLQIANDSLSREEFTVAFKAVLDYVKKLESKNSQEFDAIKQTIQDLSEKLKQDNELDLMTEKTKFGQAMDRALEEHRVSLNFLRDKARNIQAGKDGRDGLDGKDVDTTGIALEASTMAQDALKPLIPIIARDGLEAFEDDERLDWTAVKGVVGIHIGNNPPEDTTMLWIDLKGRD